MDYTTRLVIHLYKGVLFLVLCLSHGCAAQNYECGFYEKAGSPIDTGTILSPNYPSNYPNAAHCIWLIKAPKEYAVELTIHDGVKGHADEDTGICRDYVEIRHGSRESTLEFRECNTTNTTTVTSNSRWLWIRFFSDHAGTNIGFNASWSIINSTGNSGDSSPIGDCQGMNLRCANMECVSWAYHCDGWNDCGCIGGGCDEDECGGLDGWSESEKLGLGIGVGVGVFLLIFLGIGLLEILLKRHAEWRDKKLIEDQKRRAKQRKAAKAREAEGLSVPTDTSINLNASMNSSRSINSDSTIGVKSDIAPASKPTS